MARPIAIVSCIALSVAACSSAPSGVPGSGHIRAADAPSAAPTNIPPLVANTVTLPKPKVAPKTETYSVVVNNIKVQELLFALARDAKINVDIHPGIVGTVTLNAIDQTLQQLLNRIAKQVDMRWEMDGPNLAVMPDSPFLRTYRVDYVNMTRDVSATMTINPQVSSGASSAGGSGGGGSSNNSITKIEDVSKNRFWETLEKNIKDLLRETDKILWDKTCSSDAATEQNRSASSSVSAQGTGAAANVPNPAGAGVAGAGNQQAQGNAAVAASVQSNTQQSCGQFKEAASVIMSPESGLVTVRASSRQHEKIQEFIDRVMSSARRQVLIEATIAEVTLSQNYQQGIDWQRLRTDGTGWSLTQAAPNVLTAAAGAAATSTAAGGPLLSNIVQTPGGSLTSGASNSLFVLGYRGAGGSGNFSTAVKLLESFGNVKVLSSPKISVLNNQTAVLNVGNQVVYFKVNASSTTANGIATTTVDTAPQTVSVGLLMNVTPQISEDDMVLLNVRPSITRITGFKLDPNPAIPPGLSNQVPEIQRREMESILRIGNGDIAVLGGLMQDSIDYKDDGVPGLSRLPVVGGLFSYKNETNSKTELVIFLRPTIVRQGGMDGEYARFRDSLPDSGYLNRSWQPKPLDMGSRP